jgi:hypothetical protein
MSCCTARIEGGTIGGGTALLDALHWTAARLGGLAFRVAAIREQIVMSSSRLGAKLREWSIRILPQYIPAGSTHTDRWTEGLISSRVLYIERGLQSERTCPSVVQDC